jgi:hypothetical protein
MNSFHSRISVMLGMCPRCHVDPCECVKSRKPDAAQTVRELYDQLNKLSGLPEAKFRPLGSIAQASANAAQLSAQSAAAVQSATISASDATISASDATTYPVSSISYPSGGFAPSATIAADMVSHNGTLISVASVSNPKLPKDEFVPSWDREEDMPEPEEIDDLPADTPSEKLARAVETVRRRLADDVHHSIINNNFVLADKLMTMTAMEVFERYSEGSTA